MVPVAPRTLLPGLALAAMLSVLAWWIAHLPGLAALGALGIALLLGLAWRTLVGLPAAALPGTTFAARTLLRLGVVLLGVRLDFGLLWHSGPRVLVVDLLVVGLGLVVIERLGNALGLDRGLRLAVAVGSCICGASAIAAAAPVIGADEDDVSIAVGIVSLLGTLGVLGFALLAPVLGLSVPRYGLLAGSTLHEVAQVLAAGAAHGGAALDLATVTKLTRVALLAPTLLVIGGVLRRRDRRRVAAHVIPDATPRPPLLPGFLLGFLAVGVAHSLGWVPEPAAGVLRSASAWAMTAAMAGIGLAVDLRVVRRLGGSAVGLALAGFAFTLAVAAVATIGVRP